MRTSDKIVRSSCWRQSQRTLKKMGIDRSDVIDGFVISKVDGKAVLTIADDLPWDDSGSHFNFVERKIEAYLAFIASGQLIETLPAARGKAVRIELIHEHGLSAAAERFLSAAQVQLQSLGVQFIAMGLTDGY